MDNDSRQIEEFLKPERVIIENTYMNCYRIKPESYNRNGTGLPEPVYDTRVKKFVEHTGFYYLLGSDKHYYVSGIDGFYDFCKRLGVKVVIKDCGGYSNYQISKGELMYTRK